MKQDSFLYLFDIVVKNILRRISSDMPFNQSFINELSKYISNESIRGLPIEATNSAFIELRKWIIFNDENIVGLCLFGSIVTNACTENSITIPKINNEYLSSTIQIGPSDIDGLIVVKRIKDNLPKVLGDYNIFNDRCELIGKIKRNLLENILVIENEEFENSIIFNKSLYPMYYRLLFKAGIWLRDEEKIKERFIRKTSLTETELLTLATQFYERRIVALLMFLKGICSHRVYHGYLFGSSEY